MEDSAALRMMIPIGRSGWAIAAGYLGLFSLVPIFAPFSILMAVIAIRDIKQHPEKCGMGRAIFGLVMGILGSIALMFIVGSMLLDK